MSAALATLLRQHIDGAGLSQAEFGRRVGLSRVSISHIKSDRMKIPLAKIDRAATVLGLEGEERERFVVEAWLCHSPEPLAEWVREEKGWTA